MSSWCIEYWKVEQVSYVKPDSKDISRRYFSDYKSANKFAKSVFEYGYHTNIIKE